MKRRNILILLLLFTLGAYFGYNYMYQDHRDIGAGAAKMETTAGELVAVFSANSSPDILNSTVQVSGTVTEMDGQSLTIDNGVQCSFDTPIENISVNDKVVVKGRCIGYDDLFEIVKLDQSVLIK